MSDYSIYPVFYSARDVLYQLVRSFSFAANALTNTVPLLNGESVPNFILAFIPAKINSDTLNTMTAFAVCSHLARV